MFSKEKITYYRNCFDTEEKLYRTVDRYIIYDDKISEFIEDCYNQDVLDKEYKNNLAKYIRDGIELKNLIKEADEELLKSILTYYIRGERLCEGTIANALDDNIFNMILDRFTA